jgi:hypothetical protein
MDAGAEHPQPKFVPASDAAISSIPSDVRCASSSAHAASDAPDGNERDASSSSSAAGCAAAEADSTPETATAAAVRSFETLQIM